jgi:GAF domain-containing protein
MRTQSRELEFLKLLDTLGQYLRSTRDPRKALAFTLREGRTFFQAASGCIAVAQAGERDARLLLGMPRDDSWDLEHIGRFIRHTRPPVRRDLVLARSAPRCGVGRDGVQATVAAVRSRRWPAAGEDHGGGLGCRPVDGS